MRCLPPFARRLMASTLVIASLILVHPGRPAAAQDQPPTYTNAVYARDFPDPFVIRDGEKYYAYATQTRGTGFQLMESPDLVHWTNRVLDFPISWSDEHYWAPEVVHRGDLYYMTYSARDPATRKHHIAIATAEKPTGPFRHRNLLVKGTDNEVGVIDATHFFDADGSAALIYSEETPRRVVLRGTSPDLLTVSGELVELIRPDLPWERGVTEAPSVVLRNGVYHLFYRRDRTRGPRRGAATPWATR